MYNHNIFENANGKFLYFAEPLVSNSLKDTLPAIKKIISQINLIFRADVVHRIHGDKALKLTGPTVKFFGYNQKIVTTSTGGFEPSANGRAERAIGIIKERMRASMVNACIPNVLRFWPMAAIHIAWLQRARTLNTGQTMPVWGSPVVAKFAGPGSSRPGPGRVRVV